MKTVKLFVALGMIVSNVAVAAPADALLNRYCENSKLYKLVTQQATAEVRRTMNQQAPSVRALEKQQQAIDAQNMKISMQYNQITGTYIGPSDCVLRARGRK